MADTIRQQIVSAVIAALEQITTANGYETNIGTTVEDWPTQLQGTDNEDELPVIGVFDVDETSSTPNLNSKLENHELTIQARCYLRHNTPAAQCRKVMGDIKKALGVDKTWGGLATGTRPSRQGPDIKPEGFEISAAVVEITIHYTTCAFDPY